MIFSASRNALIRAVKAAAKASGSRMDTPELRGLLFEANANTKILTITATDRYTQISSRLHCDHVLEGGTALLSPIVAEMLQLLPDNTVKMERFQNSMLLQSLQTGFSVPCLDARSFPKMQLPFPKDTICVKGINSLINRTAFAAKQQTEAQTGNSVQFVKVSITNESISAEATNGSVAAITQSLYGADGNLNLILHEKALQILSSVVKPSDELYVGIVGKFAVFIKEDLILSSILYEGAYAEGSKLIEYIKPVYRAKIDAKAFCDLTSSVSGIFSVGDDRCVNLCISENKVLMQARTAAGTAKSEISAANAIATPTDGFCYNPQLLLDCLRRVSGTLTLVVDDRGFMLLESSQSKYLIGPRRAARINIPESRKLSSTEEKKPKAKSKQKTKATTVAAA